MKTEDSIRLTGTQQPQHYHIPMGQVILESKSTD